MDLKKYIASIPGFPKEGIIFRDVTPILETPEAMHYVVDAFTEFAKQTGADLNLRTRGSWFLVWGASCLRS